MTRRGRKRLLLSVFAALLLLGLYDRVVMMDWVSSTDLEIEFAVTDARTGNPVSGARIAIQSEGGFYEEREKQDFVLITDANGMARKACRHSMCVGRTSGLGITDTSAVQLPWWLYHVEAEEFTPTAWMDLDGLALQEQIQRVGRGKTKLVIPVSMDAKHVE